MLLVLVFQFVNVKQLNAKDDFLFVLKCCCNFWKVGLNHYSVRQLLFKLSKRFFSLQCLSLRNKVLQLLENWVELLSC